MAKKSAEGPRSSESRARQRGSGSSGRGLEALADHPLAGASVETAPDEEQVLDAPEAEMSAPDAPIEEVAEQPVTHEEAAPDETPKESRTALRAVVAEVAVREKSRVVLERIERSYFDTLKKHYKNQGAAARLAGEIVNPDSLVSKELKAMRAEWIKARAGYAGAARNASEARLKASPNAAREALLKKLQARHSMNPEKGDLLARYERRYTAPVVAINAERDELAAKREGLSERQNTAVDRMLDRYKKLPPGVRIMGTSALMFGAAAAIAGTPAGWVALGVGGTSALLRWGAEAKKSKALRGLAVLTSVAGITGYIAEAAVRGGHHIKGTEAKAEETLEKREGFGNLADAKNLAKIANERRSALGAGERIAREGRMARIFGSLAGGWLFGQATHGSGPDVSGSESASTHPDSAEDVARTSGASPALETPDAQHVPEAMSAPVTATIGKGEGFNALFSDLKAGLDNTDSPVARLLAESTPSELSDRIGAFDPETGRSMEMQVGDKLFMDSEGNLRFQAADSETSSIVIDKDGVAHELENVKMIGGFAPGAAGVDPVSDVADSRETVSEEDSSSATETSATLESGSLQDQPSSGPQSLEPYVHGVAPQPHASPDAVPAAQEQSDGKGILSLEEYNAQQAEQTGEAHAAAESITNVHGIEINPSEPGAYEWKVPGTDVTYTVVSGGTPEEQSLWARAYAEEHPGSVVRFIATERDPITGVVRSRMDAWDSTGGAPEKLTDMAVRAPDGGFQPVSRININDLIRKISA